MHVCEVDYLEVKGYSPNSTSAHPLIEEPLKVIAYEHIFGRLGNKVCGHTFLSFQLFPI